MVTTNDEVCSTVVLADDRVPDGFTRTGHAHGESEKTKDSHTVGVTWENGLVDTDTGEVVDVTGLCKTDDGVDEDVCLAGTSTTDGELTVSTVHGVPGGSELVNAVVVISEP